MKKLKRTVTFVLAVALTVFPMALSTLAAEKSFSLEEDGLTLEIPEDAVVLTPSTEITDPAWQEAGIANAVETLNSYTDLGVQAQFSMEENQVNVYLTRKDSEMTQQYYNLAEMTEEEKAKFLEMFNSVNESGTTEATGEWYEGAAYPFVRNYIVSQVLGEETVYYELHYFTIVNGKSYSINTHSETDISPETEEIMLSMVNSMAFSTVTPKPEVEVDPQAVIMVFIVIAVFLFLLGTIVFSRMQTKREKRRIKALASRLSDYRKQGKEDFGPRLFENVTDYSPEAIQTFSRYQVYKRHLFRAVSSIVVTALGAIAAYYIGAEWWLTLVLVLACLYCVYKFATAANSMERALKRVYSKLRTTVAHYVFYQDEFTISGTQSNEVYPYFQISDVAEYQNYFFLYFGEEITQYISKDGFQLGEAAEFGKFIREKVAENKKQKNG